MVVSQERQALQVCVSCVSNKEAEHEDSAHTLFRIHICLLFPRVCFYKRKKRKGRNEEKKNTCLSVSRLKQELFATRNH